MIAVQVPSLQPGNSKSWCKRHEEGRGPKVTFHLRLFVSPMPRLRVCLSRILLFPVRTTAFCAPHVRVATEMSFAECVDNDCSPFGFPSDVAATATPVGSNVSCRKGIERIDMAVERNSACRRLGPRSHHPLGIVHEDEPRANVEHGCGLRISVFWQHHVDDSSSGCTLRKAVRQVLPVAACATITV